MHERASGEAARRAKRGRQPEKPSVSRVAICVSRVLLDGLQKKERLLVVYYWHYFPVVVVNYAGVLILQIYTVQNDFMDEINCEHSY